jgi:CDP-glucose 4,6-dehydratase
LSTTPSAFWRGRRVLVTGHTGFKGGWLTLALQRLGARVSGIALAPEPGPSLFEALSPWPGLDHHLLDITDGGALEAAVRRIRPELVFHLAAQALVGRSHREPAQTFATNLTGTLHLLQALRGLPGVAAAVIVTSDKVYRNDATPAAGRAFVEGDPLGGSDPYSASKAAAELAVASWRDSFGHELPAMATARAGNVFGGGDFGEARLLPDLVRSQQAGTPLVVRHPDATRPWQPVHDVVKGYLQLAQRLVESPATAPRSLNFGPPPEAHIPVRELIALFEAASGEPVPWRRAEGPLVLEAPHLSIDPGLAGRTLGWTVRQPLPQSLAGTAAWYRAWRRGEDLRPLSRQAMDEALS